MFKKTQATYREHPTVRNAEDYYRCAWRAYLLEMIREEELMAAMREALGVLDAGEQVLWEGEVACPTAYSRAR